MTPGYSSFWFVIISTLFIIVNVVFYIRVCPYLFKYEDGFLKYLPFLVSPTMLMAFQASFVTFQSLLLSEYFSIFTPYVTAATN